METSILVVFTGGTIGSSIKDGVIRNGQALSNIVRFKSITSLYPEYSFNFIETLNIFSENSRPDDWSLIANAIRSKPLNLYNGIIITYGTDTLPYASAAFSFLFADLMIPIILVASNKPLGKPGSNGIDNFINACNFIKNENIPGVYSIYQNPNGRSYLHLGSRLKSADPFCHSFHSEKEAFIAEIKSGSFLYNTDPFSVPRSILAAPKKCCIKLKPNFCEEILYLNPYPGFRYDYLNLHGMPKAILHSMYHSGTACTRSKHEHMNVLKFAQICNNLGVPLYMAPLISDSDIYESCEDLQDSGIIIIKDISAQAALVKIMLAYGNKECIDDIRFFIQETNLAFEFITKAEERDSDKSTHPIEKPHLNYL